MTNARNATPETRLPLALRKQLLITRIAVDRVEFIQAAEEFRARAHPARLLSRMLAGSAVGLLRPGSWMRLFGLTRRYPYLSSVLGTMLPLLLRSRTVRGLAARLFKAGALGGAIYGALRFVRRRPDRPEPG